MPVNRVPASERGEQNFAIHRVDARQDLLGFVAEIVPDIEQQLVEDPKGWIEELSLINQMLSGDPLGSMVGIDPVPSENDVHLSDDIILGRPDARRDRGLWIRDGDWRHYRLGETAVLRIDDSLDEPNIDALLPENFTETGELIKDEKRKIIRLAIDSASGAIDIFAKGSVMVKSYYYEYAQPTHRKTPIAGMAHIRPDDEHRRMQELGALGVAVPNIVGSYEALTEQWLFTEAVAGREIPEYLDDRDARTRIIAQDARMLAALCRSGYRKQGFADFDDKLYDGEDLYLIDADELVDLYGYMNIDFRSLLLDPLNEDKLAGFKQLQKKIFLSMLRDALFEYKDSLLDTEAAAFQYVREFITALNWVGSEVSLENLLQISDDYMTTDRYMGLMLDN